MLILLGLVLIMIAAGSFAIAVATSVHYTTQIPLSGLGVSFAATPLIMFLAGAVSVILLGLGSVLIRQGARRAMGRRKELKQLRKDATAATGTADGSPAKSDGTAKIPDGSTGSGSDTNTDAPLHRDTE
ncbi:MAG TPA: hypothetical protein VFE92_10535 [Dermatophilaceae bacterium]|nr:hypothetical protein [Dermatophilaceae bacterium]